LSTWLDCCVRLEEVSLIMLLLLFTFLIAKVTSQFQITCQNMNLF
jgi:hypothetical protein